MKPTRRDILTLRLWTNAMHDRNSGLCFISSPSFVYFSLNFLITLHHTYHRTTRAPAHRDISPDDACSALPLTSRSLSYRRREKTLYFTTTAPFDYLGNIILYLLWQRRKSHAFGCAWTTFYRYLKTLFQQSPREAR